MTALGLLVAAVVGFAAGWALEARFGWLDRLRAWVRSLPKWPRE